MSYDLHPVIAAWIEWISADGQASMDMGSCSEHDLDAQLVAARAELIAQCGSAADAMDILDGRFLVVVADDDDDRDRRWYAVRTLEQDVAPATMRSQITHHTRPHRGGAYEHDGNQDRGLAAHAG